MVIGSVTTSHIAKMLDEKGFEIDKRNITLSSKVNSTGEYEAIFIKLHKDITHEITLNVNAGTNIKKKKKASKKKKEEISDESVKNPEEKISEKEKSNTKKDNKKEETVKDKSEPKEDPEKEEVNSLKNIKTFTNLIFAPDERKLSS